MNCRICGNTRHNRTFSVREMMFGTGEEFPYIECNHCGCLQLAQVPADLTRHYPVDYYSFAGDPEQPVSSSVERWMRRRRDRYAVQGRGLSGKLIENRFPDPGLRALRECRYSLSSRMLDVGCGSGRLVYSLRELGYLNVLGIDPYLESDIEYDNGLRLLRRSINEMAGPWDVIMFHHVFEHLSDPAEALRSVRRLLAPSGTAIIRIPIAGSHAWAQYGADWVQLDAPRHIFLHSVDSMRALINDAGLRLQRIEHDSTAFQFWGSEQYRLGIALRSERSYAMNPGASIFSRSRIREFMRMAQRLNRLERGDQAVFYVTNDDCD